MLEKQRVMDSAPEKVRVELANTAGAEAETTGPVRGEAAFVGVLKAKVDLLNAAQDIEKDLWEDRKIEQEAHKVDVTNFESDIDRRQAENVELKDRLVKGRCPYFQIKDGLHKFTKRVVAKFTKGFYFARVEILSRSPDAEFFVLNC